MAASRLEKCGTAVIIMDGKAYQLDSSNGEVTICEIHELSSNQEETDTRVPPLYCQTSVQVSCSEDS